MHILAWGTNTTELKDLRTCSSTANPLHQQHRCSHSSASLALSCCSLCCCETPSIYGIEQSHTRHYKCYTYRVRVRTAQSIGSSLSMCDHDTHAHFKLWTAITSSIRNMSYTRHTTDAIHCIRINTNNNKFYTTHRICKCTHAHAPIHMHMWIHRHTWSQRRVLKLGSC